MFNICKKQHRKVNKIKILKVNIYKKSYFFSLTAPYTYVLLKPICKHQYLAFKRTVNDRLLCSF